MQSKFVVDATDVDASFRIRDYLHKILLPIFKEHRSVVFICIGTDRSTGDALGPLVGEKLKYLPRNDVYIYGNLENPVHAKNIEDILVEINTKLPNAYIVAIDACLGALENVGKIFISEKPIYPGMAVNKKLPPVGDLSIVGIVNISGSLEFMVLQNTRLHTVMKLADSISIGISHCILKCIGKKKNIINATIEGIINTN
ncbi:putative sporulation protein YyaC [Clostridium cavendishii DSM 21758]|uniref:Putative sporulation protein YyaC n=1 Tax=Clostridium cavendishii DSM 21758 TaxID=1121302 RepID=A0A1M6TK42_9CLOT|nr:spore protease YyaC [Clostridium cavendishii]SHK57269.1 putative sporulation protein YyaC [Clostridium cavendishii DSM 21758]